MFCWNGEYWQVGCDKRTSFLRNRRGFELISLQVRHLGREFLASELTHEGKARSRTHGHEAMRVVDDRGTPVLDVEAERADRRRLTEIRSAVKNLRELNDLDHAPRLEEEQDFLIRELAQAIELFGRVTARKSGSDRAKDRIQGLRHSISIYRRRLVRTLQTPQVISAPRGRTCDSDGRGRRGEAFRAGACSY